MPFYDSTANEIIVRPVSTRLLDSRVPGIAGALFISQSTVRNHLSDMFRKVGVNSQEQLLALLRANVRAQSQPLPLPHDDEEAESAG